MRYLFLILVCIVFYACNTPYYVNVNNMGGQPATMQLKNGQTLTGKIQVHSFDNYSTIRYVAFANGTSKEYQNYNLIEIDNLYFNGSTFYVKMLKDNELWGGNALQFVKELSANSKDLKLFENEIVTKSTDGKEITERQLFVQLPQNATEIYNAQGSKFIPNFDEKVSVYLHNCSPLSQKIKDKNKDFFYAFVNQGETKRKQIWMNILNEYNNCKNKNN